MDGKVFNFATSAGRLVLMLASLAIARAESVRPAALFCDYAVLQRGVPIPVWGQAAPGEEVVVRIAGKRAAGRVDLDGNWRVTLDPITEPGPFELHIAAYSESVTFRDVMVGEVWLCAGQSNMNWELREARDGEKEVAAARHPRIRLFDVARVASDVPSGDFRGRWTVCAPETAATFSAVAYFLGRDLERDLDVPIGLIHSSWGGTKTQVWTPLDVMRADVRLAPILETEEARLKNLPAARKRYLQERLDWESRRAKSATGAGGVPLPPTLASRSGPGHLFNSMIYPLAPYALRGVAWYQGESNRDDASQFRLLLPALIRSWRDLWQQAHPRVGADFPFLIVRIPNHGRAGDNPNPAPGWPEIREAQRLTAAELPHVSLVETIDIGEAGTIHPLNKRDVGVRLARVAAEMVYAKPGASGGPRFIDAQVIGSGIEVSLAVGGRELVCRTEQVSGFTVAGADGVFFRAEAKISGTRVIVSCAQVASPQRVRYLWNDNPKASLFDSDGLPLGPFEWRSKNSE